MPALVFDDEIAVPDERGVMHIDLLTEAMRQRRTKQQREWRDQRKRWQPTDYQALNAKRPHQRAEARAGRDLRALRRGDRGDAVDPAVLL